MSLGWIKFAYWKFLSQPASDRLIYRLIDRGGIASITEIGVPTGLRTERMIAIAKRHRPAGQIRYAGLDLFEARPATAPGLSLKDCFRLLSRTGVQVRLVPGDQRAGVLQAANTLPRTDLVVIDAGIDRAVFEPAWFYFPRMLHDKSIVLVGSQHQGKTTYQSLTFAQVGELARAAAGTVKRAG